MKSKTTKKEALSSAVEQTVEVGIVQAVDVSLIDLESNYRTTFQGSETQELAVALRTVGLINPILIRPTSNGRYQLVAGNRRFLANEINGSKTILSTIREMTDEEVLDYQFSENMQRVDVNPLEEALWQEFNLRACAGKQWLPEEDLKKWQRSKKQENTQSEPEYVQLQLMSA